jgi:VCBS repeat-containing protein
VQNFHVTVTATCSGEVYDSQMVQTAAASDLTTAATSELGENAQLLGQIATTITGVQVLNHQQGTLAVSLTAEGRWAYQFTDEQKQSLTRMISGKSVQDAQTLLSRQAHIEHVTITTAHSFWLWNTIPTDLKKINMTILE